MRCRSQEGIGLLYSSTFRDKAFSLEFAQRNLGLLSGVLDVNVEVASVSRQAGIIGGPDQWSTRLAALQADLRGDGDEADW